MSKPTVEVDKTKLTKCIEKLESTKSYDNQSQLWKDAADAYNAGKPKVKITHSIAMLRARQWNIPIKTKKGREVQKTEKVPVKIVTSSSVVENLRMEVPKHFLSLVEKVAKGSKAAACKLFCVQCVGYDKNEVRNCSANNCPLHGVRPYQKK